MVRLRCADRLGASAYPVCRVGRKRRTEGCRAGAVRDGETAFSRDASEAFGTAAESFFKGVPPGMCGGSLHKRVWGVPLLDAVRHVRGSPRQDASGDFPETTVPA